GGTVAFTSDGGAVPGCGAVAVAPATGRAVCRASLHAGTRVVRAAYAGDAYFGPSTSATLSVRVASRTSLSYVRLSARRVTSRAGVVLRLTLSRAAPVHVSIGRRLSGHKVNRRCHTGRGHGARCTVTRRARRLSFRAKRGRNRRHLRLRGLAPGRYALAISVVGHGSGRSRTVTLRLRIVRPKR
ncbi:MAG: Ig-like domain-containing protein, partial [Solirubrobacteraceae bacterium]